MATHLRYVQSTRWGRNKISKLYTYEQEGASTRLVSCRATFLVELQTTQGEKRMHAIAWAFEGHMAIWQSPFCFEYRGDQEGLQGGAKSYLP